MTVKSASIRLCANHTHGDHPQLRIISDWLHKGRCVSHSNLRLHLPRFMKLECLGVLAHGAAKFIEEELPLIPGLASPDGGLHKDFTSLARPLSTTEIFCSPSDGSRVRVAYQGVPGAYSEDAALKTYPMCCTVSCEQTEAALKAVELSLVEKAVLPIESSVGGSIHRNYDLFLRHRLHIVAEVHLVVNHCLLGLPGSRKEKLNRVLSDHHVLDQCEIMLNNLGVVKVKADDTAGAAQIVAFYGLRDTGAVASGRAAELYGLDILAERIQDDTHNITRFLILAREPIIPGSQRPHKTSIVFTLEEGTGVLFKILAVFALRGINLLKLEARPQKKHPLRIVDDNMKGTAKYFRYLFFMDFEASMAESRAQYALGQLQELARSLRVLGCYPMDTTL